MDTNILIHPALVHLPIGLVAGAFIFGWLGLLSKKEGMVRSARHCLVLAFLSWFPVVLFGLMDWLHFYRGAWLPPIKLKMALSGIFFILLLAAALFFKRQEELRSKVPLIFYTLCLFTVVLLGFFGAQLVYEEKTPTEAKAYAAGEKLFEANCVGCHPQGGNCTQARSTDQKFTQVEGSRHLYCLDSSSPGAYAPVP